jgi:hypothetical protein
MPTKAEIEAELRKRIAAVVVEGFSDREDIIGQLAESAQDEYGRDDLEPLVEKLTDAALAEHHRKQAKWKGLTDNDRLDRAFEMLERAGIVARQNFTCCSNCGHYEIGDEIKAARKKRRPVSGYAFYHMQDTESAVEGGGIYIKYDTLTSDDEKKKQVGRKIVEALEESDLDAVWNGDPNTAILVRLKWQKRRPADELEELKAK